MAQLALSTFLDTLLKILFIGHVARVGLRVKILLMYLFPTIVRLWMSLHFMKALMEHSYSRACITSSTSITEAAPCCVVLVH